MATGVGAPRRTTTTNDDVPADDRRPPSGTEPSVHATTRTRERLRNREGVEPGAALEEEHQKLRGRVGALEDENAALRDRLSALEAEVDAGSDHAVVQDDD